MNVARVSGALTAVGHRLVVSGGFNNDDNAYELDSVEIYQPGVKTFEL